MRRLPIKKSDNHKLIMSAVYDYYKSSANMARQNQVAIFLMGRKKGIILTKEELSDVWAIKENLKDSVYIGNLAK